MALVAMADLPYGYYVLMRLVVCATAIYVLVVAAKSHQMWTAWLCAIIGLLFNPLIPVHLTKGIWQPLDFLAAAALGLAGFTVRADVERTGKAPPPV